MIIDGKKQKQTKHDISSNQENYNKLIIELGLISFEIKKFEDYVKSLYEEKNNIETTLFKITKKLEKEQK